MKSEKTVFTIIGLLSAVVIGFLFWLIYFKTAADSIGLSWVEYLPFLNAILNTLTATLLVIGYIFIKKNKVNAHIISMVAATTTSALFLISYVLYHHYHGDTKFLAQGWIRPTYFFILITHILLSIVQVPLILSTLYLAAVKNYRKHKTVAKITFPIWLYVSVTGVLIFIILKMFN